MGLTPLVLALAAVALLRFAHAFKRLRGRGRHDHAGWDRLALFAAGLALAVAPVLWRAGEGSQAGHMLEHVLLGDVAAALLVLAVRGPLLFFLLPPACTRAVTRRAPLRAAARLLTRPTLALVGWAAAYAAWHVPQAYELALAHGSLHAVQHASFAFAGVLVWTQLVDPAGRRALGLGGRLAFAGLLFACGAMLGNVLMLTPEPLYAAGTRGLGDQQLAGLVMMAEQLLTLGAFATLALRPYLRPPRGHALARA